MVILNIKPVASSTREISTNECLKNIKIDKYCPLVNAALSLGCVRLIDAANAVVGPLKSLANGLPLEPTDYKY